MLKSMTGFGAGRATVGSEDISVEVRSLNHKFCEVKVRIPREISTLETNVIKRVRGSVARGSVEVTVKRQGSSSGLGTVPLLDLGLAQEYRKILSVLASQCGLEETIRLEDIASQPGVIKLGEPSVDPSSALAALDGALNEALRHLVEMRELEGSAIEADLQIHWELLKTRTQEIALLAPRAVQDYRLKLAEKISELTRSIPVDSQRIAQEVAYFAERTDVAEEMARLQSHLEQFKNLLSQPEPSGRRLDFLVQEMHREVNTTGSKSQNSEITFRVLELKAELERIREQVQNVE